MHFDLLIMVKYIFIERKNPEKRLLIILLMSVNLDD